MPTSPAALVLTPSAGASKDDASLVALDEAMSARGLFVSRIDFPYRVAGRRFPDRPPVCIATIAAAANDLVVARGIDESAVLLGGRSMGGRMCSMAAAEGLCCAGLVCISYPLHPPKRPDQLRVAHFPSIDVPCLFISGDRDAFGTPDELEDATKSIPGTVTHVWIAGGDHGLRGKDAVVIAAVGDWLATL